MLSLSAEFEYFYIPEESPGSETILCGIKLSNDSFMNMNDSKPLIDSELHQLSENWNAITGFQNYTEFFLDLSQDTETSWYHQHVLKYKGTFLLFKKIVCE